MIWERISQEDDQHVKRLVSLKNPNLASIWIDLDSHYWIVSTFLTRSFHEQILNFSKKL